MKFEPNTIYHLFNQGNNKTRIFYQERNYLFFTEKIRKHILPYADILSYCLMPNHFHLLIYPNEDACRNFNSKTQVLSRSIGDMLSSYTKAINRQENRTGSLFRQHTKAKSGGIQQFITEKGKYHEYFFNNKKSYSRIVFEYIHNNPVAAGLAARQEEWDFSSAKDYAINTPYSICNLQLARDLDLVG